MVALQYATSTSGQPERRVLRDFVEWRDGLRSVQQLSAFRNVDRNLASGTVDPEPVRIAEMTASGFAVARTAPLLGRYLVPDDEHDGAPPVVVIGHDAWQRRFAGDPAIVGRTILLGAVPHTVVGVMPQGFAFPLDHQFWTALRSNPSAHQRLEGPVPVRVRPALAGRQPRGRASGAVNHRPARRDRGSGGVRPAAPDRAALHARTRRDRPSADRLDAACRAAAAGGIARRCGGQSRHPGVRTDGHEARRDCGSQRSRRQPAADPRATLHGSVGVVSAWRNDRAGAVAARARVAAVDGRRHRERAVLDDLRAVFWHGRFRVRARGARSVDRRRSAGLEDHRPAAALAAQSAGRHYRDAAGRHMDDAGCRAGRGRRRGLAGGGLHGVRSRANGVLRTGIPRRRVRHGQGGRARGRRQRGHPCRGRTRRARACAPVRAQITGRDGARRCRCRDVVGHSWIRRRPHHRLRGW